MIDRTLVRWIPVFGVIAAAALLLIVNVGKRSGGDQQVVTREGGPSEHRETLKPTLGNSSDRHRPETLSPRPTPTGNLAVRAQARVPEIHKLIARLYFALEGDSRSDFQESAKHDARKKVLKELLMASEDSSVLAGVLIVVKEGSAYRESVKRLKVEFTVIVSTDAQLRAWASSPEIVEFLSAYVLDPSAASNVRTFAAATLAIHSFLLAQLPPDKLLASAYRLDQATQSSLAQLLVSTAGTGDAELTDETLRITGPYLSRSEELRQAFSRLAADPPSDMKLRGRLATILADQKWAIYEDPAIFRFMMESLDPKDKRMFQAVTESFAGSKLMNGEDPRCEEYFKRLTVAYGSLEASSGNSRDPRGSVIRTVVPMDVSGAPSLVAKYLEDPSVPGETKQELLASIIVIASGQSSVKHRYSRTRGEMTASFQRLRETFSGQQELRDLVSEALRALHN